MRGLILRGSFTSLLVSLSSLALEYSEFLEPRESLKSFQFLSANLLIKNLRCNSFSSSLPKCFFIFSFSGSKSFYKPVRSMYRVLGEIRGKISEVFGKFSLEEWFQILKKPFDVKRSSDSKYSSLMSVARREVHDFSTFKHQKVINPRFEGVLHETLKFFLAIKG